MKGKHAGQDTSDLVNDTHVFPDDSDITASAPYLPFPLVPDMLATWHADRSTPIRRSSSWRPRYAASAGQTKTS